MARSELTVQKAVITGLTPSFTSANVDGHSIKNDGNTCIYVKNTDASPITVTLITPAKVGGVNVEDPTVSVPATTGERIIGPFDPRAFAQPNGDVNIDFSAVAGVTIAAFSFAE